MRHSTRSSRVLRHFCALFFVLLNVVAVRAQGTDFLPPLVISFSFDPTTVIDSASAQPVTFTLRITDNSSGFQSASWRLVSPSGRTYHAMSISSANRISGTSLDGIYQTVYSLPAHSEAGTWHAAALRVTDADGNVRAYDDTPSYGSPSVLSSPFSRVFARDFNRDDITDIAVIYTGPPAPPPTTTVAVYLGTANGVFASSPSHVRTFQNYPGPVLEPGDFNGDGNLDLAFQEVADEIGGGTPIGVLFGNGDGTFQTYRSAGSLPISLATVEAAVGDFDADGRSDIAGAGNWGSLLGPPHSGIIFLWGRSDGNFDSLALDLAEGSNSAMLFADVNGDGKPDLVWAKNGLGKFVVMLGQGNRSFGSPIEHTSAGTPTFFAAADFNNDGKLDLSVIYGGQIGILRGNGDGTFQQVSSIGTFDLGQVSGVDRLRVADFDRDGTPDLAADQPEGIALFLANGDGTYRRYAVTAGITGPHTYDEPADFGFADFNGDGLTDFVAGWLDNKFGVYLGLSNVSVSMTASSPATTLAQAVTLTATVTPSSLIGPVTFYDGENVLGMAALSAGQAIFTTRMLHPGTHALSAAYRGTLLGLPARFSSPVTHTVNASPASRLSALPETNTSVALVGLGAGDFNRDGHVDLVAAGNGISFAMFLGNGNGTLQPAVNYGGYVGYSRPPVVVGDLNSDGNPDVGVNTAGIAEYKGNGDGTFTIMNASNGVTGGTLFADVNRDGVLDRISGYYGTISVLLGIGSQNGSTLGMTFTTTVASHESEMALGDFNEDGNLDIVLTSELDNVLVLLLGNGDGTFDPPTAVNPGSGPRSPIVADFNGDGKPDLAFIQSGSGTVRILFGNGNGAFPSYSDTTLGGTLTRMAAADLDGNGTLDLAVLSTSLDRLLALPGNGNGSFGTARMYYTGTGPVDLVAADFNEDGRMDLAVASSSGPSAGQLCILLGVNPGATSVSLIVTPAASSLSQQVAMTATVGPPGVVGWVTFYDGATVLGSAQVSGGQAVVQTKLLGSGTHLLRAVFSGNGTTYSSSISALQIQKTAASSVFAFGPSVSLFPSTVESHALADFNKDGIPDLAVKSGGSLTVLLGQGNGQFATAAPTPAYSGFMAMVSADFDRDGNADLLLNAWGSGGFLYLGKGDGTFQSPRPVSGLELSGQLIAADLNADGAPDLLDPGNSAGSSFALLNRGDGTFESPIRYGANSIYSSLLEVGDLNGDGRADLAIPYDANNYVEVWIGKGDGTFLAPVQYPTVASPYKITIGYWNADSIPDLAILGSEGRVGIMLGLGPGTFENWGDVVTGLGFVTYFDMCDYDGDGKADLLISGSMGGPLKAMILRGLGNGTFESARDYVSFPEGNLHFVTDLNLDGKPDLLMIQYVGVQYSLFVKMAIYASSSSLMVNPTPAKLSTEATLTASVLPVDAAGTVAFYDDAALLGKATLSSGQAVLKTKWLGAGVHKLRARYLGDPLRYAVNVSAIVSGTVRSGRSSGFRAGTIFATGRGPRGVAVGDLNKDGKQDIVVANATSNTISVLLGNGTGGFAPRVGYNVSSAPVALAVTDMNGDGNPDVAVANSGGGNVSILPGNGDGTLQTAVNNSIGPSPVSIVAADLNGDALADLVIGSTDGVYALLGTTGAMSLKTIGAVVLSGAGAADVNGDGLVDVPVMGSGSVWVRLQGQDGTFSNSSFVGVGTTPAALATADFNGDGKVDIATANTGSNNVSVVIGKGDGSFQPAVSYAAGTGPVAIAATDYNGDGKLDLVVVNQSANSLTLLRGKGDGTFLEGSPVVGGGSPAGVVAADFNGDGIVDLAVTNSADDTVSVFPGIKSVMSDIDFDGDGKSSPAVFRSGIWYALSSSIPGNYFGTQWGMAGDVPVAGDYDGDGITDIAVRRPATGIWYILLSGTPGNYLAIQWGTPSDVAVPGDYDGDGRTDIAVWRPSKGVWYALLSGTPGNYTETQWGTLSDVAVPGDYDGDGRTDIAVWRPSNGVWYALLSGTPGTYTAKQWGISSDRATPGDYDGDGITDTAVWRPLSGVWHILLSGTPGGYVATQWGMPADKPVGGDFDGDGRTDIAFYRPDVGMWFIQSSATAGSFAVTQWGASGDVPVSALTGVLP